MQIALNLISPCGVNTRFVSLIGGPCTYGPGLVVDIPRKIMIRSFIHIFENTEHAHNYKKACAFYDKLSALLIQYQCTMDIWAFGTDQFGLMEMRSLANKTGGILASH